MYVDLSGSENEGKDLRALAFGFCVSHTCQHVLARMCWYALCTLNPGAALQGMLSDEEDEHSSVGTVHYSQAG